MPARKRVDTSWQKPTGYWTQATTPSRRKMMSDKKPPEPHVGIFWLVKGKLIIDTTPVSKAEPYGDHVGHSTSHIDYWAELQRNRLVPPESEYEEYPRGRVMHHPASGEFTILADKCIADRKELVSEIKKTLHLPVNKTKIGSDPHYRCFTCLYGKNEDDED
jgi:hypothetical protein